MAGGVLTVLALGTIQGAGVTIDLDPMPLSRILEQLSLKSGRVLKAAEPMRHEFGMLVVRDRPVEEVTEKLAVAFDAEWVQKEDGLYLTRGDKLLRQQEEDYYRRLAEEFSRDRSVIARELEDQGAFDDNRAKVLAAQVDALVQGSRNGQNINWDTQSRATRESPAGRLIAQIVLKLRPEDVVRLGQMDVQVLSTHPNRLQSSMPDGALDLLKKYAAERLAYLKYLARYEANTFRTFRDGFSTIHTARDLADQVPAKAVLVVRPLDYSRGFTFELVIGNRSGELLDSTSLYVGRDNVALPSIPGGSKIQWSPRTLQFKEESWNFMSQSPEAVAFDSLSAETKGILTLPESRLFGELAVDDAFRALLKDEPLNLVARVTRFLGSWTHNRFSRIEMTVNGLVSLLKTPSYGALYSRQPGWHVVSSDSPVRDRRLALKPQQEGTFLRKVAKEGSYSILEFGDITEPAPVGAYSVDLFGMLMLCLPNSNGMNVSSEHLLKLSGALGPQIRNQLFAGSSIPFLNLPVRAQHALTRIITDVQRTECYFEQVVDEARTGGVLLSDNLSSEKFPNGIPPSALLTLQKSVYERIYCFPPPSEPQTSMAEETFESFALRIKRRRNGDPDVNRPWGQFRSMVGSTVTFRLYFNSKFFLSGSIDDIASTSRWVDTPEKLPSEVWQRIQSLIR